MSEFAGVIIVGPTASGKSSLAHEIALSLGNTDIATVDSMTVYRGMDIGTAKATARDRAEVPYHLLDLVEPHEEFDVAEFQRVALDVRARVATEGRTLVHVGGTGLYGRAVIDALEIPPRFPELRATLEARAANELPALYEELLERDPLAASRMEPTNERRVVRALEVIYGTGRSFSSYGPGLEHYSGGSLMQIGIDVGVTETDERIAARFHSWMDQGFLHEVEALSQSALGISRTARQAVGYRELLEHVEQGRDLSTCVDDAITATRRLARRQRRWFRRDPRVNWHDDIATAREAVLRVLERQSSNVGD